MDFTRWNSDYNGDQPIFYQAYDYQDGDPATLTDMEKDYIRRAWLKTAEDVIEYRLRLGSVPGVPVLFVRNLFFTVVAEETLFRQVIQSGLEGHCRGGRARWYALLSASILFGAVHLPGGRQFGLLATLAGLVYGYVCLRSTRIEIAILAHVALNTGNVLLLAAPGS